MWFRRWRTVCSQDEVSIQTIEVGLGDILILRHPYRLSDSAQANMKASIRDMFPHNRALILEEGMSLEVARKRKPSETADLNALLDKIRERDAKGEKE